MNVYQLTINSDKSKWFCAGVAMVAAPTYEAAIAEYCANGDYGKELASGDIVLNATCDIASIGLYYDGRIQIICDHFFVEKD